MGRLVAQNGQITLLREALNTVAAASALLLGDTHDLPEPTNEIHAVCSSRSASSNRKGDKRKWHV